MTLSRFVVSFVLRFSGYFGGSAAFFGGLTVILAGQRLFWRFNGYFGGSAVILAVLRLFWRFSSYFVGSAVILEVKRLFWRYCRYFGGHFHLFNTIVSDLKVGLFERSFWPVYGGYFSDLASKQVHFGLNTAEPQNAPQPQLRKSEQTHTSKGSHLLNMLIASEFCRHIFGALRLFFYFMILVVHWCSDLV